MTNNSNWKLEEVYEKLKDDGVNIDDEFIFTHKTKTNNKSKKLSLGRIWFNIIVPDQYELINEPVNKKSLEKIFYRIMNDFDAQEGSKIISDIQKEAFKMSSLLSKSFKIETFTPSQEWKKKKDAFLDEFDDLSHQEIIKRKKELMDDLVSELKQHNIGVVDGMESRVSGKMSKEALESLFISKGMASDIEGNISKVKHGINDGYNVDEFYKSAAEARKGQFYKSTAVQDPGYLSRKVVMANAHISANKDDCKTKKYMPLYISNKNLEYIQGRYFLNEEKDQLEKITYDHSNLIGKTIKLRSPLFCKDKDGICKTCYGELQEKLNTKNIGVLAGGVINNVLVNAMMGLRHKSSQVEYVDVNFIESLKKSSADYDYISNFVSVEEKQVVAKTPLTITINMTEYNDDSLIDTGDHYLIPGLLNCEYHGEEKSENFFFPYNFNVELMKPDNIKKYRSDLILEYEEGDVLFKRDMYIKDVNPYVVTKMLDGVIKYIKDPVILVDVLKDEVPGIDLVHLELIVSNIFRQENDNEKYARLNNYKDPVIIGCKKLPSVDSWISALAFEDINKATKTALAKGKHAKMDPIEKIVLNQSEV